MRVHRLVFNVTSVGRDEDIYLAELRLFRLVEADRNRYDGINRRVTVSELTGDVTAGDGGGDGPPSSPLDQPSRRYETIVAKDIYGRQSGWETFTVTDAVKRWVRSRSVAQVRIVRI